MTIGREFPFPVVVLAFNRPHALDRLLAGLLTQRTAVRPGQVILLQDGVINPWSNEKKISFELAESVYQAGRRHLPPENILRQDRNVGIGLMYREAYSIAFETLDADYAVFFEDDFLLGPFYMDALMRLHELMQEHERVAFANAIGHIYPSQCVGSPTVVNQLHLWGHLVSRRHWRQMELAVRGYYRLVEKVDYRDRPHTQILDWFRSHQLGADKTSFDEAVMAMAATHGFARINTLKGFGELQKVTGVHMTQAYLDTLVEAQVGTMADAAGLHISKEELDAILAFELDEVRQDRPLTPDGVRNLSFPPRAWGRQIADSQAVRWTYRILLEREPGPAEVNGHELGRHSIAELRAILLSSKEYRKKKYRK